MIPGIIIGMILVVLIIGLIGCYNGLVSANIIIDEAFATMDVYLKKRYDLLPNLVETVKGYAKHEENTLKELTNLRAQTYASMSAEQKLESGAAISQALPKIMALSEAYPELKANENFCQLSAEINQIEDDIANARKYYNGAVKQYNMKVAMFPSSLVASLFHFEAKKMFEVSNASERENVQVRF